MISDECRIYDIFLHGSLASRGLLSLNTDIFCVTQRASCVGGNQSSMVELSFSCIHLLDLSHFSEMIRLFIQIFIFYYIDGGD